MYPESISCAVIDDNSYATELILNYIENDPNFSIQLSANNPLVAIEKLNNKNVDLIFLDIDMPGCSGLELLTQLETIPMVIFTTASNEYALQGFEYNIVDYLQKPITFERFELALERVKKRYWQNQKIAQ